MIIVQITGGLGNQMFQYAMGRSLSEQSSMPLKLDISSYENYKPHSFLLDRLNIKAEIASREEINQVKKKKREFKFPFTNRRSINYVKEEGFTFNPEVLKLKTSTYFSGYWQSEKYFKNIETHIRKEFVLKKELAQSREKIFKEILASRKPVSIHVRRGDYVSNAKANAFHGTCEPEWYAKAIQEIRKNSVEITPVVFSDDIDWVKKNIELDCNVIWVEPDEDGHDFEDMYLMSVCQNHITANSTFSWWGAWLNPNKDKRVIVPNKWFNSQSMKTIDLIPAGWERV